MAIQVPKLSKSMLQKEVDRIREQKASSGGTDFASINRFNFKTGSNRIRLLPPSIKGLVEGVAMLVYKHWKLPGDKAQEICISSTYPNCGATCPIDAVCKKHKDAGMDTYAWAASGKAVTNILDRKEEGKLAQLCDLPMGVYNWLVASIVEEGMMDAFYDPKRGVDLIVVKSISKSDKGEKTEYKASWSPKGPSPIASDPGQLREILESCYEVSEIFREFDPKSDWGKKTMMRLKATANALDRRLMDRSGATEDDDQSYETDPDVEPEVDEEVEPVADDDEEESAITKNPNNKPPCFGHTHADKTVEYEEVEGGYNPGEYRCVMCPEQTPCSSIVTRKFPSHYAEDGSEIVPVDEIVPAKRTASAPPPKKKAATPPPPPPKKKVVAPPPKKAVAKGRR
jgi:hypothetical protein